MLPNNTTLSYEQIKNHYMYLKIHQVHLYLNIILCDSRENCQFFSESTKISKPVICRLIQKLLCNLYEKENLLKFFQAKNIQHVKTVCRQICHVTLVFCSIFQAWVGGTVYQFFSLQEADRTILKKAPNTSMKFLRCDTQTIDGSCFT